MPRCAQQASVGNRPHAPRAPLHPSSSEKRCASLWPVHRGRRAFSRRNASDHKRSPQKRPPPAAWPRSSPRRVTVIW